MSLVWIAGRIKKMSPCKGICDYSPHTIRGGDAVNVDKKTGKSIYESNPEAGVRYCVLCAVYLRTNHEFNRCPCCHSLLRGVARNRKKRMTRLQWQAKALVA